jgi:hypothetical protein
MTEVQIQKLHAFAKKCDARLQKQGKQDEHSNDIANYLNDLLSGREIEVGCRQQCGRTDATVFIAREWFKVVKLAREFGLTFAVKRVKHDNAWATLSGGYWSSFKYQIERS